MKIEPIPLEKLLVHRSNDRHGALENEDEAIKWLFDDNESHMRNLAADIVGQGKIYEPPLVMKHENGNYIVYDGNRRTTCLKILAGLSSAPSQNIAKFFHTLRNQWPGDFPRHINCQVESNIDDVDRIIFRRHTGSQQGVGQSTWNDRMKNNFALRTGQGGGITVADAVENLLKSEGIFSSTLNIPRSTFNRIFSSEKLRKKIGFSFKKGELNFLWERDIVLNFLKTVVQDILGKKVTLKYILDFKDKEDYLNRILSSHEFPIDDLESKDKSAKRDENSDDNNSGKKPRLKKPSRGARIIYDGNLDRLLGNNCSYKVHSLYRSIVELDCQAHTPLISVGIWSLIESLTAAIGREAHISFDSFLNADWLAKNGFGNKKATSHMRGVVKRLSDNGNATKHDQAAACFNSDQLISDMEVVSPILTKCAEIISNS